jgi:hypothetical protein
VLTIQVGGGRHGGIHGAHLAPGVHTRCAAADKKRQFGNLSQQPRTQRLPRCFRCHGDSHATTDNKTIIQDCGVCHQALAVEETAPEILKTPGLDEKISSLEDK